MFKTALICFAILFSLNSFAINEKNFHHLFNQDVLPYSFKSQIETMEGVNRLSIRFQVFNEFSSHCLLILPGRQEPLEKYAELAFDINHSQLFSPMTIIIVDHRGQGLSGRMTNNSQIGYVDRFEDYVSDSKKILRTRMSELGCKSNYLLAHSMGGAIGLGLLQEEQIKFKAAVFSTPMWMINTKPYPNFVASMISGLSDLLGKSKEYAFGQHDYVASSLTESTTTHSLSRYEMSEQIYRDQPETKVGGVSNRWIFESLKFTKQLRKKSKDIHLPIVVFQAGLDTYVKKEGQDQICHQLKFCQKYIFPTSFHEIFMEHDKIRNEALLITLRFFLEHR
jgi:lysophospholipase